MPHLPMSTTGRLALGLTATAVGCTAYAAGFEVRSYRLRRIDVPVLAPGSRPLRVLHVSDLHLTPGQDARSAWLRRLGALEPDLVVNTGDNLAHRDSPSGRAGRAGAATRASGRLRPRVQRLLRSAGRRTRRGTCCLGPRERGSSGVTCRGRSFGTGSSRPAGSTSPTRRGSLQVDGRALAFAGVDDPHLGLRPVCRTWRARPTDADLTIGVAHAPYLRVLDG